VRSFLRARLDDSFRRLVHAAAAGAPPRRFGLEHEFRVLERGTQLDFHRLIHVLGLGPARLDPADPNAYRLPSGVAVTCDGAEAEIALPPMAVRPGLPHLVTTAAVRERAMLSARLPVGLELEGCSTHLSIEMSDRYTREVSELYARTFAPAMMLLLDRRESPGLLIRPRPGRLELGGEFADGDALRAAVVFAVGSALACEAAVAGIHDSGGSLPGPLHVGIEAAVARYGWYVDRRAFGGDLYADGRQAELRTLAGMTLTAQEHLEATWETVRDALAGVLEAADLESAAAVVEGRQPLPSESDGPIDRVPTGTVDRATDTAGSPTDPVDPYGAALADRSRPGFDLAPVMLTWETVVFVVADRTRRRRLFIRTPGERLGTFLALLDAGRLDRSLLIALHLGSDRVLSDRVPPEVGLFGHLGPRLHLLAPEFGPDGEPVELAA
jgi:hypothetical protein